MKLTSILESITASFIVYHGTNVLFNKFDKTKATDGHYSDGFYFSVRDNQTIDFIEKVSCFKWDNITSGYNSTVYVDYNTTFDNRIRMYLINNSQPFVYNFPAYKLIEQDNIQFTCIIGDYNITSTVSKVRDYKYNLMNLEQSPIYKIDKVNNFAILCDIKDGIDEYNNTYTIKYTYADCNGDGKYEYFQEHSNLQYELYSFQCVYRFLDDYTVNAGCVIARDNENASWELQPCKEIGIDDDYCVLNTQAEIGVYI